MKEIENNMYYQTGIKTSRNEDSVYAMKYASQQMMIDKLQKENQELKEQLEQKEDIINSIKEYVKHTEYFYTKGRLQCVDYKINGFKILELIDNKGE